MGNQNGEPGVPENVDAPSAAPLHTPATQGEGLVAPAHAPVAPALAPAAPALTPVAKDNAPVAQARAPATQAQDPADQVHAPATQAQDPADQVQAQDPADHVQALAPVAKDNAPVAQAHAPATQAQDPADQVQAQDPADHVQALAPVAKDNAPVAQAHAPATQAQDPADQVQALAIQAQALATRVQVLATQAQALVAPNTDAEKSVVAYKEIANLHNINLHYPIHKLALEEWQRKEEYLSSSVSRREVRSAELTNQIYNIVGWFAVFQGVVLTAVSQLTQTANSEIGGVPLCGKIWFPILLTGFATLATIVGILHKFTSLQSLEFTIHTEKQAKIEVARRASSLRTEGPQKFNFRLHTNNALPATKPKPFWKNRVLVIVTLVIFAGIFILTYFVILCDTGVVRNWDGGLHR